MTDEEQKEDDPQKSEMITLADDPNRFPESKLFNLKIREYLDIRGDDADFDDYEYVGVHDQRFYLFNYRKKGWSHWQADNTKANSLPNFLSKVPKSAEAVVNYEITVSGCGAGSYAGQLVIQRGIALIPKKKKAD